MKKTALIVEDEFIVAEDLRIIMEKSGYCVTAIAESVQEAVSIMGNAPPGLVLLDINLKGELTGIDLGKILFEKSIPFIYISAYCTQKIIEQANKTHPYGFLVKPFRSIDVLVAIEIAEYRFKSGVLLSEGKRELPNPIPDSVHVVSGGDKNPEFPMVKTSSLKIAGGEVVSEFHGIVGSDPALLEIISQAVRVAPFDTTLLILGETGTGKERLAHAIHMASGRSGFQMVKINCAALPQELIESELFGYEMGAFTGAVTTREGKIERADGGTLLLDEIGEIPLVIQSKLLRVLQDKEVERIGGKTSKKIDVRILATTNRNLVKEVAEGRFRMDLYFRISVFSLELPPLRERKSDIRQLAFYFAEKTFQKFRIKFPGIHPDMLEKLAEYDWPGNVRELENVIEQSAVLLETGRMLEWKGPKSQISVGSAIPKDLEDLRQRQRKAERDYIISVLREAGGRVRGEQGAAQMLNLPPTTLESRIASLGIEKADYMGKDRH